MAKFFDYIERNRLRVRGFLTRIDTIGCGSALRHFVDSMTRIPGRVCSQATAMASLCSRRVAYFFTRKYTTRFRVLLACYSLIGVVAFFGAVIPAKAILQMGPYGAETEPAGGLELFAQNWNSAASRYFRPDIYPAAPTAFRSASSENEIITLDGVKLARVGTFKITHYCACTICTYGTGITATGMQVREGMAAADWSILPPHTVIYIKRGDTVQRYVIEDRGGGVQGNHIDVYIPTHDEALRLGVYNAEVYTPVQ